MSSNIPRSGLDPATGFAKRVLVVDPDQKAWELPARLLIAQGHVVHRISYIEEAPPHWPHHLYDLVVIATQDPANPELMEFCKKLRQARPPVCVALLASGSTGPCPVAAVIPCDRPAAETADEIARMLR